MKKGEVPLEISCLKAYRNWLAAGIGELIGSGCDANVRLPPSVEVDHRLHLFRAGAGDAVHVPPVRAPLGHYPVWLGAEVGPEYVAEVETVAPLVRRDGDPVVVKCQIEIILGGEVYGGLDQLRSHPFEHGPAPVVYFFFLWAVGVGVAWTIHIPRPFALPCEVRLPV